MIDRGFEKLYQAAASQGGYFTRAQARDLGYSDALLHYYVANRMAERPRRGILRLSRFPPQENEDLIIAWLWSERTAVFSHETALAMLDISDVLPSRLHLTLPTTWRQRRLRAPANVILHFADVAKNEVSWRGPVPMTSPLRTIVDCILESGSPDIAEQARKTAIKRGIATQRAIRLELDRRIHDERAKNGRRRT